MQSAASSGLLLYNIVVAIVLVLDGNSKLVLHAYRKTGIFQEKS